MNKQTRVTKHRKWSKLYSILQKQRFITGANQKTRTDAKLGYKKKMKSNRPRAPTRVQKLENEQTSVTKSDLHTINFLPRQQ